MGRKVRRAFRPLTAVDAREQSNIHGRRFARRAALLFAACLLFGLPEEARSESRTVVQVRFPDLATMDQFLAGHPDTEIRTGRRIVRPELEVSESAMAEIQARGYPYRVVPEREVSDLIPEAPGPHNHINTSLYTQQQCEDSLAALAVRYQALTQLITIGLSREGRPIRALKVSDNAGIDEDEPVMLIVATTHADEDVGVDIALAFLRRVLEGYGVNPTTTAMVQQSEVWAVPLLNPDGWMLLESGTLRDWRKNTHDNNGDQQFDSGDGVDINRNFSFNWEYGTGTLTGYPTYRGPFPFSEAENCVLRDFMLGIRPTIALSYHQSGDAVLIPWLWNGRATPDSSTYRPIAARIANEITNPSGTRFEWYEYAETAGFMDEWVYGVGGGFCFTIEVSALDPQAINGAVAGNQAGIDQAWSELFGSQVTGQVRDAATAQPLDAEIQVLEIDTSQLLPRRADPATGRYRRLLAPGAYTLRAQAAGHMATTLPFVVGAGPTVVDIQLASQTTGVLARADPTQLRLEAYPSPARTQLRIGFDPGPPGPARLEVYDLSGRRVRSLLDGTVASGWSRLDWNGTDDGGRVLPAGIYRLRLSRGEAARTRTIVWMP